MPEDLLGNLVDNAPHCSTESGHIIVRRGSRRDATRLEVEDDGPGIPEAENHIATRTSVMTYGESPSAPRKLAPAKVGAREWQLPVGSDHS